MQSPLTPQRHRTVHPILAASNFAQWAAALLTGKSEVVASLYTENLTLLPTMAERVITNHKGAEEYFTFFGSFSPTVKMVEEHVIPISEESYLHCGIYAFTLKTNERVEVVPARFSMVWEKIDDTWKILHHHSSRIPTV